MERSCRNTLDLLSAASIIIIVYDHSKSISFLHFSSFIIAYLSDFPNGKEE
ncbi:hypothetical protein NBRC111894_2922 [Sporolactobacillus inulinus]|uniref:Uncharacterized protein n=1 Tax=Sporolactobacillus inulinus TaxID=2078 RepID=A0A4Y1ZFV9_9BACL|nr:hypothetical protein NBRC111894_2922 [Sporolactobacillus inulinus]